MVRIRRRRGTARAPCDSRLIFRMVQAKLTIHVGINPNDLFDLRFLAAARTSNRSGSGRDSRSAAGPGEALFADILGHV